MPGRGASPFNTSHRSWLVGTRPSVSGVLGSTGEPKYGVTMLFDEAARKTPQYEAMKKLAVHAAREKFGDKLKPDGKGWFIGLRNPFRDGAEKSELGTVFAANMPTEEVYTLPKRDGVNGIVYATKPLNFNGNLIEDFWLRFENGRVVDFAAKKGEAILKGLIETDEGSHFLGEVALVPYDSPISKSGVLFYNTLFDENAACHLALGKAYPTCLKDGEKMDSVTLLQHGVNDSLMHEDFMVGSRDLEIVGTRCDGTKVQVFHQGNFAF